MPLSTPGAWLLGVLLSFSLVAHGGDVDPTEDFCSLSEHMSRTPPSLPKYFLSLFTDWRSKNVVAQKDGILYIAGGLMQYSSPYAGYNGPSSCSPFECTTSSPFSELTIRQHV